MPRTLLGFHWENKLFLYFLPAVPLLLSFRWIFHVGLRQKIDIAFHPDAARGFNWTALLRFIPYTFHLLAIAFVLIALARPQKVSEIREQYGEGIDIIIAMDVSESMLLEDFSPNRLEAAKQVARNFIKQRQHDRIGLVVFSGDAYSLSPLTTDYQLLSEFIEEIKPGMIDAGGTAIGNALGVSINRLRESQTASKVIILLSDGENTAGNLDPIMAAKLAHAFQIKTYTIGIGKDGEVPYGTDSTGKPIYIKSSLDETTLRKIAQIGEGQFFRASTLKSLNDIFYRIDNYEKTEIIETRFKDNEDFYRIYLIWGIIFLLIALSLKNTFLSNALED
ncbi:MAG TPA: VWA domain-containing protein [Cytophagaceae bacterium]